MQIKSNQEVRNYKEVIYFGMTVRQLVFSALAGVSALSIFFLCNGRLPMEMVSWLCILAAVPFAAFGFIRWHGMYMEDIIKVFIRSRFVVGHTVYFRPQNDNKALIVAYLKEKEREEANAAKRKKGKNKTP